MNAHGFSSVETRDRDRTVQCTLMTLTQLLSYYAGFLMLFNLEKNWQI